MPTNADAEWLANKIPSAWSEVKGGLSDKDWFVRLAAFVRSSYAESTALPREDEIFAALRVPPGEVRVVILGRDPYPQKENACGLAFSAPRSKEDVPKSLAGIIRELEREGYFKTFAHSRDLSKWAEQGVLLLNTTLTIKEGDTGSHEGKGWAHFTRRVLKALDNRPETNLPIFLLWGCHAKKRRSLVKNADDNKLVLTAPHPSCRAFIGCDQFKKVNEILKQQHEGEIIW